MIYVRVRVRVRVRIRIRAVLLQQPSFEVTPMMPCIVACMPLDAP